jgi:hypothetical protein
MILNQATKIGELFKVSDHFNISTIGKVHFWKIYESYTAIPAGKPKGRFSTAH